MPRERSETPPNGGGASDNAQDPSTGLARAPGRAGRRPNLRPHIARLQNPGNDARDLTAALQRLGFEVTTEFDADRGRDIQPRCPRSSRCSPEVERH